jgi:hypothetical protein
VPAFVFYLGGALALAVLAHGVRWCWRAGERTVLAGLGAAVTLWLYGLAGGTPYQEAKALVILAPVVMLVSARGIVETAPDPDETRRILGRRSLALLFPGRARAAREKLVVGAVGVAFFAAAGLSTALALVNGPVGPTDYSPALADLRAKLGPGSTLVLAPPQLLDDEHGRDYLTWELRGHRVCVAPIGTNPPKGIAQVITVATDPVEPEGAYVNRSQGSAAAPGPCPLISDTARADPAGNG